MSSVKYLIASLGVVLILGSASASNILGTSILFRHGERAPETIFPNLPCSACTELGTGQLTKGGSREMYENGVMLRLKYLDLFPKNGFFNKSNMRIISSKSDRCIMSLQSFMAGFMPPPILDTTLPIYWQPYTFEIDYNGRIVYLNQNTALCPAFFKVAYGYLDNPSPTLRSWYVADQQAFHEASVKLGVPLNTMMDVFMTTDALKVLIAIDKKVPTWAKDLFEKTFKKYNILIKEFAHSSVDNIKIRGGPMVQQMVTNMEALANNDASAKKMLLFSAHDITVASLAFALGVEDQIPEPISFSDTIMVDLVRSASGELTVEVIYMDNQNTIPKTFNLNVPGCGKSCKLSTFKNAVKDMMITESQLDQLCGL